MYIYIYTYIHINIYQHHAVGRKDANEEEFTPLASTCITDTYTHMYLCLYIYTHKHTHTIHFHTYTYEHLAVCWKDADERKFDHATHKRVHHRHIRVSLEIMKQMLRHFPARMPQRTIHLHIYTPSVQPERDHLLLIKIRKHQLATKFTISNDCRAIFYEIFMNRSAHTFFWCKFSKVRVVLISYGIFSSELILRISCSTIRALDQMRRPLSLCSVYEGINSQMSTRH